jgi:hypothetical protein
MSTRRTHWAWAAAAVAALALTTGLYARPEMAIALAEQFWACFGI